MTHKINWGEVIPKAVLGYILVEYLSKGPPQVPFGMPPATISQPFCPQLTSPVSISPSIPLLNGQMPAVGQQVQLSIPESQPELQKIVLPVDTKWLEVVPHPSVLLILGRRGSGKSALGYRLLELFRFRALPFVLGMPQQGQKLLPGWMGSINDPSEAPQGSTVLFDEAHIRYDSRESQKSSNREIRRIINLSRQRQQTLIFVSQQARYVSKDIAGSADVLVVKEPEPLQPKFERQEINKIVKIAAEKFGGLSGSKKKLSLVYSPSANFLDLLSNELPSFWSRKLSCAYSASSSAATTKPATTVLKKERIRRAKQLASMDVSVSQIGKEIGV